MIVSNTQERENRTVEMKLRRQAVMLEKPRSKVAVMADEQAQKLKRNKSQAFSKGFTQIKNIINNQMIEGLKQRAKRLDLEVKQRQVELIRQSNSKLAGAI